MLKTLFYIICNIVVLFIADNLLANFEVSSIWAAFLFVVVLSFLNWIILPTLKLIAFPINFLTLGLFGVFLSLLMVWITTSVVQGISLTGSFSDKLISAIVISIFLALAQALVGSFVDDDNRVSNRQIN